MPDAVPPPERAGQSVEAARVGGDVVQIQDVSGNVRVGIIHAFPRKVWIPAVTALAGVLGWVVVDAARGGGRPGPSASGTRTPALSVATAVNPLRRIRSDAGDDSFFFSKTAAALSPMPPGYLSDRGIVRRWGYGNGGVDAGLTFVELVVQGTSRKSVVLTDLRFRVQRLPAPLGLVVKATPGGDGIEGRIATVDLDASPPKISGMRNDPDPEADGSRWSFPLRVTESEPEVLYLFAICQRHDCRWSAELHYVADGEHGVVTVDNKGRPFRTVGPVNSVRYEVRDGRIVPAPSF